MKAVTRSIRPKNDRNMGDIRAAQAIIVRATDETSNSLTGVGKELVVAMSFVRIGGRGCFLGRYPVHSA